RESLAQGILIRQRQKGQKYKFAKAGFSRHRASQGVQNSASLAAAMVANLTQYAPDPNGMRVDRPGGAGERDC
ncbi:MAG TPA: hypothetical protein V6D46_02205, partial [Coleofasciculaceae cyanobacterium]